MDWNGTQIKLFNNKGLNKFNVHPVLIKALLVSKTADNAERYCLDSITIYLSSLCPKPKKNTNVNIDYLIL